MAGAVVARQQGDDYQARVFWAHASFLFLPETKVARVGFELDGVKAFDDVVVTYSTPLQDVRGRPITKDFFQVKFHVDQSDSITHTSLIDPKAIGATSYSLLERLRDGVRQHGTSGARFTLVSAWPIHPDDELRRAVGNHDGEIRLDKLFDGTTDASRMGRIRNVWRRHLRVGDDELRHIMSHFRFGAAPHVSLAFAGDYVNRCLSSAGLRPIPADCVNNPYDDLIRKLHACGMNDLNRDTLQFQCDLAGLWVGRVVESAPRISVGIRSFLRFAEELHNETAQLLCLAGQFEGRRLRGGATWQGEVATPVNDFLRAKLSRGEKYLLHLDAHSSVAFLAGYVLDSKAGVDVALVQRGANGSSIWEPNHGPPQSGELVSMTRMSMGAHGPDLAVALGVSHSIRADVEAYVRAILPSVGTLIVIEPLPRPGFNSVRDASHAFSIAESVKDHLRTHRPAPPGMIHLFTSSPNGLLFYLGQMASWLGTVRCYEFHLGGCDSASYEATITLPLNA